MKQYETEKIRNIAILGHLGCGKTSLSESILLATGAIEKKGEVEKKSTVSDYLPEEHARLTSLSMSLIPVEWKDYKFNFIDTPGSEEFMGEINQALSIVKGAVLVIDGSKGIEVGTERLWIELTKRHIPTLIYINKLDKENIKFEELMTKIRDRFGKQVVPFAWPIGEGETFNGYVNLVDDQAKISNGTMCVDAPMPDDLSDKASELREQIMESVAETSEELLEKYFSGEALTKEEIHSGLRKGVLDGELKPILVGSATNTLGVRTMLDMLVYFLPAPNELNPMKGKDLSSDQVVERKTIDSEPFSAYVFKTTVDPFIGAVNLFKVVSGTLSVGKEVMITNTKKTEKINQLFSLRGKQQISVDALSAGDIGAVAKLDNIYTGCTLADPKKPIIFEPAEVPSPTIYVAIHPKNKQDEDKISSALQRLNFEDPTFEVRRNKETAQLLIGGQGMTHIGYIVEKMKNMFKVEVDTSDQKIVYRETIKQKTQAQGRHKKQSGGSGQFGDVHIRFEPLNPNEHDFEFTEEVFGGAVPKNYFPAVEKGLIDILEKGPLAGFPVIGLRATLYDGSYHAVDSNEISFKLAAGLAFKEACKTAKPTILEPIMNVKIMVKDEYVGDVMGDINKRRGRVLGMEPIEGGMQVISADIPEAEIVKYTIDLKAMTQGSGSFTRDFARYDEVPSHLIDKIIEEHKKEK
ncbi:elongation factor G [Liberiplasma polymorphum]|uniref:elongation factor G n=1 Tax=Liberiplasma polymorphum TaxID=3374570 RepID=UPI0037720882